MTQKFDIAAIGECLVDFTPAEHIGKYPVYLQNPGGAPANMISAAAKLGANVAFLGKVGDDQFGHFLRCVLIEQNVCVDGLKIDTKYKTTLAFVTLSENGKRGFVFYRDPGADEMLLAEELDYKIIAASKVLHISSLAFCGDEISRATEAAADYARKAGKFISYDANWRPKLWKNIEYGKNRLAEGVKYADIVKASEEELAILSGTDCEPEGAMSLLNRGVKILVVTKGAQGSTIYTDEYHIDIPAFPVVAVDTTGAGDAFFGSLIAQLLREESPIGVSRSLMYEYACFSSAFAAISTTRPGGIPSLPTVKETVTFVEKSKR